MPSPRTRSPHAIELLLRSTSRRLLNWDRYTVRQDMFDAGVAWTFTLWYSRKVDALWETVKREVRVGEEVVFSIDGAPQISGRIERATIKVSRKGGMSLTISGRDTAGPAIKWDADPRITLYNRALPDVGKELFAQLGINLALLDAAGVREVQSRARPGARAPAKTTRHNTRRVDLSHARPNETVWAVWSSITKNLGFMSWVAPTPDGTLGVVVDTPNYKQPALFKLRRRLSAGVVTQDSNILDSEFTVDISDVPTVVYAFSRPGRGDKRTARHRSIHVNSRFGDAINNDVTLEFLRYDSGTGRVEPPTTERWNGEDGPRAPQPITRQAFSNDGLSAWSCVALPMPPQPKFLHGRRARNPDTGAQEARRYMSQRMKDFRTVKLVTRGHGQVVDGEMRIFAVNMMATVDDELLDVAEDMLIHAVEFEGGRKVGQTTTLTLGTKDMINLEPEAT